MTDKLNVNKVKIVDKTVNETADLDCQKTLFTIINYLQILFFHFENIYMIFMDVINIIKKNVSF